jgi:hypothetical protein
VKNNITKLRDARVFKRRGWPLNMPVREATFSTEYSVRLLALHKAHDRFMSTLLDKKQLRANKLKAIAAEMQKCDAFINKLTGVPPGEEPNFKTEQDKHECLIMSYFIAERALPFVNFWRDVLASGAGGVNSMDVPKWYDEEDER